MTQVLRFLWAALVAGFLLGACTQTPHLEGPRAQLIPGIAAPRDRAQMDLEIRQVPVTAHFACGRGLIGVVFYHYIACAKIPPDAALNGRRPWCRIYVPDWVDVPDNLAAAEGLLEHELRHCEGWAHPLPAHHAGPGRRATESRLYLPHSRSRITTSRPATSAARASLALPRPGVQKKSPARSGAL